MITDAEHIETPASAKIRDAWEQVRESSASKIPRTGTSVTTVRMTDGLTCEVEQGPWKFRVDMPEKYGGNGAGPDPGVVGRGAFGSCLAITYLMQAAREGVHIESLDVEVQADYEVGATFGIGEARAGYTELRYVVKVKADLSEQELQRLLDKAESRANYLNIFRDPLKVRRETELKPIT